MSDSVVYDSDCDGMTAFDDVLLNLIAPDSKIDETVDADDFEHEEVFTQKTLFEPIVVDSTQDAFEDSFENNSVSLLKSVDEYVISSENENDYSLDAIMASFVTPVTLPAASANATVLDQPVETFNESVETTATNTNTNFEASGNSTLNFQSFKKVS